MKEKILTYLPKNHPWQDRIICHENIPSTNDLAKSLAKAGAAEGTVVIAREQSAGRGRMGRSFHAPAGLGLYFSVILRPQCTPDALLHLTCATGVAVCDAIEGCSQLRPGIKWINDLVVSNKKLGGILTELSVDSKTGLVDWAVVGIGINCCHQMQDFPEDLQSIATSLYIAGKDVSPVLLAAHLIQTLYESNKILLSQRNNIMERYRLDCITTGRQVVLVRGDERQYGTALRVEDDGGLTVHFDNGQVRTVQSGEVSIRGLYGYL